MASRVPKLLQRCGALLHPVRKKVPKTSVGRVPAVQQQATSRASAFPVLFAPRRIICSGVTPLVMTPVRLMSSFPQHVLLPGAFREARRLGRYERRMMSLSPGDDPYKILGVQPGQSDRDYKVAYLKLAKQFHPDLNPGDAEATRRFQQLAAAYDAIKNETSRQAWRQRQSQSQHSNGDPRGAWSGFGRTDPARQADAEDVWNAAAKDAAAMAEAFGDFLQEQANEIEKDVNAFSVAAYRGDWPVARELAMKRKGLIIGVAVPLLVLLRWPAAAVAALRVASLGAGALLKVVGVFIVGAVRGNPRLLLGLWQLLGPLATALWESGVRRARERLRGKQGPGAQRARPEELGAKIR